MKTNETLLKELDLIDATISRLDAQIQTSKNICITLWTAWLGWFVKFILENPDEGKAWLLFGALFFPILFWAMDYNWRKALLSTSLRQKRIAVFLNSRLGMSWLEDANKTAFPILDPVGWLYDGSAYSEVFEKIKSEEGYNANFLKKAWEDIVLGKSLKPINVLLYKEAKWFYPTLIIVPIVLHICL